MVMINDPAFLFSILPFIFIAFLSGAGIIALFYLVFLIYQSPGNHTKKQTASPRNLKSLLTALRKRQKKVPSTGNETSVAIQTSSKKDEVPRSNLPSSASPKTISELEAEVVKLEAMLKAANLEKDSALQESVTLRARIQTLEKDLGLLTGKIQALFGEHPEDLPLKELNDLVGNLDSTPTEGAAQQPGGAPEKLLITEQAQEIQRLKDLLLYYKEHLGEPVKEAS